MKPIFIILYAVIITLILTLVLPRFRQASPTLKRVLWVAVTIGGVAMLVITYFAYLT
jgi:ABC-type cobalamin transport system permease subunit